MYHIYRTLHFQAFADILKTDMNKDVIKNNIRKLREEKGWTQAELGAKLFVSDKLISKWERGESLPDSDNLVRLASLAGQSAGEFIGGDRIYSDDDCVAKTPPEKRRLKYNVVSFIADIGIVALITAMFVLAAMAYEDLPNIIGIHFNIEGEADGFGDKGFLFLLPGMGALFGAIALIVNLVKARWSINLLVPVFLDTLATGKTLEKLLKIMSASVNITILFLNAMFLQATYAMAKQQRLVIGVYFGWLAAILVTVIGAVLVGAYVVSKGKAEEKIGE